MALRFKKSNTFYSALTPKIIKSKDIAKNQTLPLVTKLQTFFEL